MIQVFRDTCRRTYIQEGLSSIMLLWTLTTIDYVTTVIEENVDRGLEMSRTKISKLGGWALIVAGISIFIGYLATSRPEYDQYNFASQPIDRYANIAAPVLLILGFLLAVVGMVGLLVRYGERASSFGRISLWIGIVSGLIGAAGIAGLYLEIDFFWYVSWSSIGIMFLGLTLFGVDSLFNNTMGRWNGVTIVAGIGAASFALINGFYELATQGEWLPLPDIVFHLIFVVTGIGLVATGYVLQSDIVEESGSTVLAT